MQVRAQNIAQLFLQLHGAGASGAELARVRDSYLLALQLYSGLFTGSGNTTLSHEIGTGSLAHHYGGSLHQLLAGMLHGAYLVGDWGEYRLRVTASKRAALRAAAGERAEAYVYAFACRPWDAETVASYVRRLDGLDQFERELVFVRLVEELERMLDCGALICFRPPALRVWLRARRDDLCALAEGLGHRSLGAALAEALDMTDASELPPEIVGIPFPGEATGLLVPRSYGRRMRFAWYQRAAGYARRLQGELARRTGRAMPAAGAAGWRRP
jgi:hypothetical protein